MFALYSVLTRLVTRDETPFVALFWSGILGAVLMTLAGAAWWQPMAPADWVLTAANGGLALLANWLMIRCYAVAEASAVQPFAYLQLVFVAIMGVFVFNEVLTLPTLIGAGIVVAAGLAALMVAERRA